MKWRVRNEPVWELGGFLHVAKGLLKSVTWMTKPYHQTGFILSLSIVVLR